VGWISWKNHISLSHLEQTMVRFLFPFDKIEKSISFLGDIQDAVYDFVMYQYDVIDKLRDTEKTEIDAVVMKAGRKGYTIDCVDLESKKHSFAGSLKTVKNGGNFILFIDGFAIQKTDIFLHNVPRSTMKFGAVLEDALWILILEKKKTIIFETNEWTYELNVRAGKDDQMLLQIDIRLCPAEEYNSIHPYTNIVILDLDRRDVPWKKIALFYGTEEEQKTTQEESKEEDVVFPSELWQVLENSIKSLQKENHSKAHKRSVVFNLLKELTTLQSAVYNINHDLQNEYFNLLEKENREKKERIKELEAEIKEMKENEKDLDLITEHLTKRKRGN
jgi:hypothetical protein